MIKWLGKIIVLGVVYAAAVASLECYFDTAAYSNSPDGKMKNRIIFQN